MEKTQIRQKTCRSLWFSCFVALSTAIVLTVILVTAVVAAVKIWMLPDRTIVALNYTVRVVCLAGGALVFARSGCLKAWQRALLLGGGYWILLYLLHTLTASLRAEISAAAADAALCILISFIFSVLFAKH